MLAELAAFLDEHRRRPNAGRHDIARGRGSEWALGHWLVVQRSDDRLGRLPGHRARALDKVLPSWRVDDRTLAGEVAWRLRLVGVLRFCQEHGRLPKHTDNKNPAGEPGFGMWLDPQPKNHRNGRLHPERAMWFDRQVGNWGSAAPTVSVSTGLAD
ncbi:hypothetical protein [Citricoccus nitrophenolicus]|uniref:hypothetical protein n=1 Tax=Citricoccus nitrophenolicus TaxID=863575 RepID=UPI003386F131